MSLILVQFPIALKLSGPFIWAEAERRTLPENRCSGCLMLARGGPAGLETRSNHDPVLETHNTPTPLLLPFWWSSQVPKIHETVLNKTSDTVTPWLMAGQKEPPWGRRGLGLTASYQLNLLQKVSVKSPTEWGSCPVGCGAECDSADTTLAVQTTILPLL